MNKQGKTIELSLVIPTLDEETAMPALFESLSVQKEVVFEIVISDGGSRNSTLEQAEELAFRSSIPLTIVTGPPGRGAQLNRGAGASMGEHLLFLHADCRFSDPLALKKGVMLLSEQAGKTVAAKFALCFQRTEARPALSYYFYESKARQIRAECTHGDQGLMMARGTFSTVGPFDEFPAILAETRFAERVRTTGQLLLIPAEIFTSARRFEIEGMYQRQAVNAILMNCAAQGWHEPFRAVSGIYRTQSDARELRILPILETIRRLIAGLPPLERRRFWRLTGAYVRANAWQLAFFLDARRNFSKGERPGEGPTPFLDRFDRTVAPMLKRRSCDLAATVLTWLWFTLTRLACRLTP